MEGKYSPNKTTSSCLNTGKNTYNTVQTTISSTLPQITTSSIGTVLIIPYQKYTENYTHVYLVHYTLHNALEKSMHVLREDLHCSHGFQYTL